MSNIVEADYQIVQERTLPVIIGEIKIIEQNVAKTAMEGAIQIGQRLQEAKAQIGHGGFDTWCKENLNYTRRTAENFMRIAREYGGENGLLAKTKMSSHFSISNALSLLKVPEEDREKFVEEHEVEDMTNKALEAEIRRLKEAKEASEADMDRILDEKKDMAIQIETMKARMRSLEDRLENAEPSENTKELQEQLGAIQQKLAAANTNLHNTKEKLKKEKEGRTAAIDQAIGNQRRAIEQEIRKEAEAELAKAKGRIEELSEQVGQLEKRAENAGSERKVQFKILMDQLQETFRRAQECVDGEADEQMKQKMNAAMKQVVQSFLEVL